MNILILNYEYPPLGGGGGVISKHIASLLAERHEVTVVTTWYPGLEQYEEDDSVHIIRVASKRRNTYRSSALEMLSWISHSKKALKKLCEIHRYDVCFANFVLPGGEVALYLKKNFGIPYVLLSHGHDIPWVKPYTTLLPLHVAAYFRLKRICKESEKVFVQTKLMKQNADQFIGAKFNHKVEVIPNGCVEPILNVEKRSGTKLNIVFVGRLVSQKAPMDFLNAMSILFESVTDFKVSIYGDGPLRKRMERYVSESNFAVRATFYGKVGQEQVMEAYSKAHIMVAPSESEGMSISMLEALSTGVYLVTTNVSGVEEMVEKKLNGDVVSFNDPAAIARSIEQYYREKFANGYIVPRSFLHHFQQKFSWEAIVKMYEAQLQEIVWHKQEPIRVLHVIDNLGLGGAQALLRSIITAPNPNNCDRVFGLRQTDICVMKEGDRVKVYRSSSRLSPLPILALCREIEENNITVLHCHLPRSIVFGYLVKALFKPKLKLVFHEHGDIYEEGWILPKLLKLFSRKTNMVLACSDAAKSMLVERAQLEPNKIKVLRNCFEGAKTSETQRRKSSEESFTVGFAGRLVSRKGWLDFLQMAKKVLELQTSREVKFLIAGAGPDDKLMRTKIEEFGLREQVTMLGYTEDMSSFYNEIDCCVIPSAWEGMPLVQLESMASGVPIVTYDVPGLNEIVSQGKDALIVQLGNVLDLSEQVNRLIDNVDLRDNLRNEARKTVNTYDSRTYRESLRTRYKELF